MSVIRDFRNFPSWAALAKDMYSASHVERATVCCFLDFQEINGPFGVSSKTYPVILLLSPPQINKEADRK